MLVKKKMSKETRAKISKAMIGKANFLGKKHTDEAKEKMAIARLGKKMSDEQKLKLSEIAKHRTYTVITRTRMSSAKIGIPANGKNAKSEGHYKAKFWRIKSSNGIILEGRNLNEIIRNNPELFDRDAVVWSSRGNCLASSGLRKLFLISKHTSLPYLPVWRGWTAA